jgi:hypothetical protein
LSLWRLVSAYIYYTIYYTLYYTFCPAIYGKLWTVMEKPRPCLRGMKMPKKPVKSRLWRLMESYKKG